MRIVATTSLPAVNRPNDDRWNAGRTYQLTKPKKIFSPDRFDLLTGRVKYTVCPCPGYVLSGVRPVRVVSVRVMSCPGCVCSGSVLSGLCLSRLCRSTKRNHGTPLPAPSIKRTVKIDDNNEVYHHLEWKPVAVVRDILELKDGETLIDLDQDKLGEMEVVSSCNTRKEAFNMKSAARDISNYQSINQSYYLQNRNTN